MMNAVLVAKNVVSAKGDGPVVEIKAAESRVFLLTLEVDNIIEQESLEVSIHGSADSSTWAPKPIVTFPQKFYRGESPLILDLTGHPEVKFVRAHWEVARWGRGVETPMFEFSLGAKEIPAELLQEASAESKARENC